MGGPAHLEIDLDQTETSPGFVGLLQAARTQSGEAFAAEAFAWMASKIPFDVATMVTSFVDRPAYVDAHFHGLADPAAVLASWQAVSHLDELSPRLLQRPRCAQRQDVDAEELADDRCKPLREHLMRFALLYSACIAVPIDSASGMTVIILIRSTPGQRFTDSELSMLESLAVCVAEALAINRSIALIRSRGLGIGELPVAVADADGALVQTTPAFVRLFWPDSTPRTNQLPSDCISAIRRGDAWILPDGMYALHGVEEHPGWLLRIRAVSRLDSLSRREREVALLYAQGANHKLIASRLGLAPATVRNHLSRVYDKLGVSHRVELMAAIGSKSGSDGP